MRTFVMLLFTTTVSIGVASFIRTTLVAFSSFAFFNPHSIAPRATALRGSP